MADDFNPDNRGQVILYRTNGVNVPVEVTYWQHTFWMPQQQMADLFGVTVPNISYHLKKIYGSGELEENRTIKELLTVREEGGRTVRRGVRRRGLAVPLGDTPETLF